MLHASSSTSSVAVDTADAVAPAPARAERKSLELVICRRRDGRAALLSVLLDLAAARRLSPSSAAVDATVVARGRRLSRLELVPSRASHRALALAAAMGRVEPGRQTPPLMARVVRRVRARFRPPSTLWCSNWTGAAPPVELDPHLSTPRQFSALCIVR